jgi:hypothetical protein
MTTLVLIPARPDLHPALRAQALYLAHALEGETEIVLDDRPWHGDAQNYGDWPRRIRASAELRQAVLEDALQSHHRAVLWVDADVISYPVDLLARLDALGPENVTAPAVTLDRWKDRFYDIGGFLERRGGCLAFTRMDLPWFDQPGPVVELESVGCVYRVPADVYREGATHHVVEDDASPLGAWSDHYSVCRAALAMGRKVRADLSVRAVHAWLEDFGERAH